MKSFSQKRRMRLLLLCAVAVFCSAQLFSQQSNITQKRADSLYRAYQFSKAKELYKSLSDSASANQKQLFELRAIACENGEVMLGFVSSPKVVANKRLSKADFFLHYPQISSVGQFVYAPEAIKQSSDTLFLAGNTNSLYYSAKDDSGCWNIYRAEKGEGDIWGLPKKLSSNINSAGNELFPFISPDGSKLFFSSNGHAGAGGYDLYVSNLNPQSGEWEAASNLGFPYSSPSDDFFFYVTPDGKYAAFSSTRSIDNPDSQNSKTTDIITYLVEYEDEPITRRATPEEAAEIALLKIKGAKSSKPQESTTVSAQTDDYSRISHKHRELMKQVQQLENQQNKRRSEYAALSEQAAALSPEDTLSAKNIAKSLSALTQSIGDAETQILSLRQELKEVEIAIRQIEDNFLAKGVVVPARAEKAEGVEDIDQEEVSNLDYLLTSKANITELTDFEMVKPEPETAKKGSGKQQSTKNTKKQTGKKGKNAKEASYNVVISGFSSLPADIMSIVKGTGKDIAKISIFGEPQYYVIGPFSKMAEAQSLATKLKAAIGNSSSEQIKIEEIKRANK